MKVMAHDLIGQIISGWLIWAAFPLLTSAGIFIRFTSSAVGAGRSINGSIPDGVLHRFF